MIRKKLIEGLIAIAETGSFTKAASKLYISQSALSRTVIEFERELGVQLFDRDKTPIKLTYCGEQYLAACRVVLKINNSLENEIADILEGQKGRIVLGLSSYMSRCLSHIIVPEFWKHYPNVELKLIEVSSPNLESLVLSGEVDIAIVNSIKDPRLTLMHIVEEAVYLAAPPAYAKELNLRPGFNDVQINISDLQNYPFILLKEGHGLRNYANVLFRQCKFTPVILCETDHYDVSYNMVAAGMGFTFITDISLKYNDNIYCCSLKDVLPYRSINICMDNNIYHLKAAKYLVDLISTELRAICGK